MWYYLTLGITFGIASTIQPGPFLIYIISQTLEHGWRRSLPMSLAPMIADVPIATVVLLILSQLPPWLESALRLSGGLFILNLCYGAFKSWRDYDYTKINISSSQQQSLLNAIVVDWLNPYPYLGWSLILGPLFLKGWEEAPANGIALLSGFYFTMITSLAGIIILFAATRTLGYRINRIMIGLTAIALAGFGLYQLWLGIISLWPVE